MVEITPALLGKTVFLTDQITGTKYTVAAIVPSGSGPLLQLRSTRTGNLVVRKFRAEQVALAKTQ